MSKFPDFELDSQWILSKRGSKNKVIPTEPYHWLVEQELSNTGVVEDVATIFLTNRECPYKCLMCDLWKDTTDYSVHADAIPQQISYVLNQLNGVKNLKFYNSGNFFDLAAVPEGSHRKIAKLVDGFDTVLVESHPKIINKRTIQFQEMIKPDLQVAMGLETIHPAVLKKLNKKMELADFEKSVKFLLKNGILVRAFLLLRPPFMTEREGVEWAKRSLNFAFDIGVECCVIIPTRASNGAMNWLEQNHFFNQPLISSLEEVLEYGLGMKTGRVFADLWDLNRFSTCEDCFESRKEQLQNANLNQAAPQLVQCTCNKEH